MIEETACGYIAEVEWRVLYQASDLILRSVPPLLKSEWT